MSFPELVADLAERGEPLPDRIIIVVGSSTHPFDRLVQAASLARMANDGAQRGMILHDLAERGVDLDPLDDCGDLHAALFEIGEGLGSDRVIEYAPGPRRACVNTLVAANHSEKLLAPVFKEIEDGQRERRDALARQRGGLRRESRANLTKLRQYKAPKNGRR